MSDKQRADHVQAKYWNGFITRTEAQKVHDETAQVLMRQGEALCKMDIVISFIAEKFGITKEEIETWYKAKIDAASKSSLEKAVEKAESKLIVEA
jgi:energy-converting hydrogenase A subunit M